jgi:hypothetical protein
MLITGFVMLVKGLVIKRPVLILKETSLILRGVRPGRWKLFQLSVTKEVKDDALSLIRLGYIREKIADGLLSYPPGEPSRNAIFQSFLWLKYVEGGKTRDLYYPHTKNIANHRLLMQLLTQKYGDKVELHDWRQPV